MLLDLSPASHVQSTLFDQPDTPASRARMRALDTINRKYGRDTLRLGSSGHHPSWALRRKMLSPSYSTNWAELLRVE